MATSYPTTTLRHVKADGRNDFFCCLRAPEKCEKRNGIRQRVSAEVKCPFTQTMWKRKLDGPNFSKNGVRLEGRTACGPKVPIHPTYLGIQKSAFSNDALTSATRL